MEANPVILHGRRNGTSAPAFLVMRCSQSGAFFASSRWPLQTGLSVQPIDQKSTIYFLAEDTVGIVRVSSVSRGASSSEGMRSTSPPVRWLRRGEFQGNAMDAAHFRLM